MKLEALFFGAIFAMAVAVAGCERKERVLDIETPGADVEVDRSLEDGDVEVSIDKK